MYSEFEKQSRVSIASKETRKSDWSEGAVLIVRLFQVIDILDRFGPVRWSRRNQRKKKEGSLIWFSSLLPLSRFLYRYIFRYRGLYSTYRSTLDLSRKPRRKSSNRNTCHILSGIVGEINTQTYSHVTQCTLRLLCVNNVTIQ